MIKKVLRLSGIAAALLIGVSLITLKDQKTGDEQDLTGFIRKKLKGEEGKKPEIQGYIEWLKLVRNGGTEEFDYKRYYDVLNEIEKRHPVANRVVTLDWTELGPNNYGGRTRAILVDKDNPDIVFAGGVAGGLWRSEDAGINWSNVASFDDYLPVASIAQAADGKIYIGTGEGFTQNLGTKGVTPGFPGNGIYVTDANVSQITHLTSTGVDANLNAPNPSAGWAHVNKIVTHPTDANYIIAATKGGLMVSTDAGTSWTSAKTGRFTDVDFAADASYIMAAKGGEIYKSTDNGATFTELTGNQLPAGSINQRAEIAIAPSDANKVYAAVVKSTNSCIDNIYRSTDKGATWEIIGPGGSQNFRPYALNPTLNQCQGLYDNAIAVAIDNPDKIFLGGIDLYTWEAGEGWNKKSIWNAFPGSSIYVHADQHAIVPHPTDPNIIYFGNDGGLFKSFSGGESFVQLIRGYATVQFYTVGVGHDGSVIGGTQDNGTHLLTYNRDGIKNSLHVRGGDGGAAAISWVNPDIAFASVQGGTIGRTNTKVGPFTCFYDAYINNVAATNCQPDDGAPFVSQFLLWESIGDTFTQNEVNAELYEQTNSLVFDTTEIKGVASRVFVPTNKGVWMTHQALKITETPKWYNLATWTNATPLDLDISKDGDHLFVTTGTPGSSTGKVYRVSGLRNAPLARKWGCIVEAVKDPQGNTIGYTLKENQCDIIADSVGITLKEMFKSNNTWFAAPVTSVSVDPQDANHVVVTLGGYGSGDHVYETTNALDTVPTWTSIHGDLPAFPVYSVEVDAKDPNKIYLGTEFGVWATDNGGTNWSYTEGLPRVPVYDLKQSSLDHYASKVGEYGLFAATHGRGLWAANFDPSVAVSVEETESPVLSYNLKVYPNPAETFTYVKVPLGKASDVQVEVYNITGTLVDVLRLNDLPAGNNDVELKVDDYKAGTYLVRTKVGEKYFHNKLVVY